MHHAAVKHAFQRATAALVCAFGQPPQALALAQRIAGDAIAADAQVPPHQCTAEVVADVPVAAA